jgi:NADH dehydrogenase FAD-containing subunit
VSPTTEFYYNTASVRAIVPGQFADDRVFAPLAPGFAKYPAELFEFIQGTATSLDPAAKTVTVETAGTNKGGSQTIPYEILVISTGSSALDEVPWKNSPDGSETTKAILHKFQEKVKTAKTIAIGGGGPTGNLFLAFQSIFVGADRLGTCLLSNEALAAHCRETDSPSP